jgi:hypothetical protein
VRARSAFTVSSAQECPCCECVVYSSFRVDESETNAHVVIGSVLREAYASKSLNVAQVEPFERRFGCCMEQKKPNRGSHLTPAQAREGHRWIRLTVLAAVLQAWMIVGVITLADPRRLELFLALGVAYSLAAPLLRRYLNRDVDRRVTTASAQDSFVRLVPAGGLPSSSSLGTPPG